MTHHQHIPDEVFADAHLAAAAEVYTGTEWHAPITAAVQAAVDSFVARTTPDQRLLGMLKSLPDALYAAAEQGGHSGVLDDVRTAFQAGCALITEAVEAWLTTHTLVPVPVASPAPVASVDRFGADVITVDVGGPNGPVNGWRADDGTPFVQAGDAVWNGADAEQVALGILAVLRALRPDQGGEQA